MDLGWESLTLLLLSPLFLLCMLAEYRILRARGDADYSFKELVCNFSLAACTKAQTSSPPWY